MWLQYELQLCSTNEILNISNIDPMGKQVMLQVYMKRSKNFSERDEFEGLGHSLR